MPWAPINGINLYYELHGSGPAILFAHGQGGNHLSWWQQVPFFARHYTCITFDHRAFGFSHDLTGDGRLSFATDVIALLDHLDLQDVRVVAHSMGGRSGISVALRASERCRALVLAGTNGGVTDDAVRRRQRQAADARGDKGLGAFAVAPSFKKEQPQLYFLLRAISRVNPSRPPDFLRTPSPSNQPARAPVHQRLADAAIPVLFLVGEHDAITPPDVVELCHGLLPGSRYQMIRGSGHSAYFEKPDEFNRVVFDFLQDVDASAAVNDNDASVAAL